MEEIVVAKGETKATQYQQLLPQIEALLAGEDDITANMANVAAALHHTFGFWWTGFYLVKNKELVLGPFQGPVACTRIQYGKGVCGTAWQKEAAIVVPNVELFEGHIACSSASKSEIVVPLIKNDIVIGVLDVDSEHLAFFDDTDALFLSQIAALLVGKF